MMYECDSQQMESFMVSQIPQLSFVGFHWMKLVLCVSNIKSCTIIRVCYICTVHSQQRSEEVSYHVFFEHDRSAYSATVSSLRKKKKRKYRKKLQTPALHHIISYQMETTKK